MFSASQTTFTMGVSGGDASQMASTPEGKPARQEDKQTCVPVTIRAVELAVAKSVDEGGEVLFYGSEPGMLVLVGFVETLVRQGSGFEVCVNDGTGRIKAKHFTSSESDDLKELAVGRYISMYGQVRTAPVVHFAATGVRMVQSADEISYHMIECGHTFLKMQKVTPSFATPSKQDVQASQTVPMEVSAPAATTKLSTEGLFAALVPWLKKECESRDAEGVGIADCVSKWPLQGSQEIRGALAKLVADGEVFTTIDDDHFSVL